VVKEMNVLIVDDEKLIRDVIKEYCIKENYNTFEASNGKESIEIVKNNKIDIIIMDIMMPQMDGYSAVKEIKKIKDIPCIMLSARSEEYDKLAGFEIGIDDYITKPFSPKELIARIKAILIRIDKTIGKQYIYKTLKLDLLGRVLYIDEKKINITPKEYELLLYFIENKKVALSREQLLSTVWGYDFYGDDRTIDTHIKMLRHSLGKYRNLIETVRSVGYRFNDEK